MKKYKKIAIIGFPNVGKSTLFNRLLRAKKSLVHDLPGMTRDQISSLCELNEKNFTLIDTGGIFDTSNDPFSSLVTKKAQEASEKADIILFVLDGKRDILPAEEELYFALLKLDKPLLTVINKIDSEREADFYSDSFRLGSKNTFFISAEHKRNLTVLEDAIEKILPFTEPEKSAHDSLRIALVGRINVGKSSLINRLCGEEKLIVSAVPGTTRDSTDTVIQRDNKLYCLVDTAGIRKLSRTKDLREKAGIIKTKKNIFRTDVICLVVDATEFPTRQDTAIAHLAKESGKPLVIILNKWDLIEKNTKTTIEYTQKVFDRMSFIDYAQIFFVSAVSGQRIIRILEIAEKILLTGQKRITTSKLNVFLEQIQIKHSPISKNKTYIKIKYMTQTDVLPPTFTLFTHSQAALSASYEKFFIGALREEFGFEGSPIRIKLRRN